MPRTRSIDAKQREALNLIDLFNKNTKLSDANAFNKAQSVYINALVTFVYQCAYYDGWQDSRTKP